METEVNQDRIDYIDSRIAHWIKQGEIAERLVGEWRDARDATLLVAVENIDSD